MQLLAQCPQEAPAEWGGVRASLGGTGLQTEELEEHAAGRPGLAPWFSVSASGGVFLLVLVTAVTNSHPDESDLAERTDFPRSKG